MSVIAAKDAAVFLRAMAGSEERKADLLAPDLLAVADLIEHMEMALFRIVTRSDAYPLEIFPPVDDAYAKRAHEVLTAAGMTLDRLSADAMRRCMIDVRRIASAALQHGESAE